MCEIQFVLGKKNLTAKEKTMFFNMMENGSKGNNDAWGIYTNEMLIKEYDELSKSDTYKTLKKTVLQGETRFMIGHNRLATSGKKGNENNHPFMTENFVVVHNGILWNDDEIKLAEDLKYDEEVDSFVIPALLEKYQDSMTEDELIKFVAEQISGTFSVLIYSLKSDLFYYFKNSGTSIYAMKIKDTLFISTNERSIEPYLEDGIFLPSYKEGTFKAGYIYRIDMNGKINILDDFTEKIKVWKSYPTTFGYTKKETDKADTLRAYIEKHWFEVASLHKHDGYVDMFVMHRNIDGYNIEEFIADIEINCNVFVSSHQKRRKTMEFGIELQGEQSENYYADYESRLIEYKETIEEELIRKQVMGVFDYDSWKKGDDDYY